MNNYFKDLTVVELAGVLAGPSAGLFFAELGARVIKIENPKTNGDVTRSWKSPAEKKKDDTSAYYWSVNSNKEVLFLDLTIKKELEKLYTIIKKADIVIANYTWGDDVKLKVDYPTLKKINPKLIYASINGFGKKSTRKAYDLILQAESGFMFMNGEKKSPPLKMPVALIDVLAAHQLKEAILIALLKQQKSNVGSYVSVSLFDTAVSSLVNQATNWLIANHLPSAQGSLHPNIAPYGELFTTKDKHIITFAIGSDEQFKHLCKVLHLNNLITHKDYINNQQRVIHREKLYKVLEEKIKHVHFDKLFKSCAKHDIPIGKVRNLKEVFNLSEAKQMIQQFKDKNKVLKTVKSIAFQFE